MFLVLLYERYPVSDYHVSCTSTYDVIGSGKAIPCVDVEDNSMLFWRYFSRFYSILFSRTIIPPQAMTLVVPAWMVFLAGTPCFHVEKIILKECSQRVFSRYFSRFFPRCISHDSFRRRRWYWFPSMYDIMDVNSLMLGDETSTLCSYFCTTDIPSLSC